MNTLVRMVLAAGALGALLLTGAAHAAFVGRNASNAVDLTCTVSGATKCTSFYDTTLDVTILNNWNIGSGPWGNGPHTAQGLAELAGLAATGLVGWVLPSGDPYQPAGALNQYKSMWNQAGGTFTALQAQFDGVYLQSYWSSTPSVEGAAWVFDTGVGFQDAFLDFVEFGFVAVRPGDVAVIPEPQTVALVMAGLGVLAVMRRRRLHRFDASDSLGL